MVRLHKRYYPNNYLKDTLKVTDKNSHKFVTQEFSSLADNNANTPYTKESNLFVHYALIRVS